MGPIAVRSRTQFLIFEHLLGLPSVHAVSQALEEYRFSVLARSGPSRD